MSKNDIKKTKVPQFEVLRDMDLPDFERMVFSLYRQDPCGETISSRKIKGSVKELSSHPEKGTIFMFWTGKTVVGYSIVIYRWSNEYGGNVALIDELYVKPRWRRKGIGASFIEHIATLKGRLLKGIQIEVNPENGRALAFYNSLGFSSIKNLSLFKRIPQKRIPQKADH